MGVLLRLGRATRCRVSPSVAFEVVDVRRLERSLASALEHEGQPTPPPEQRGQPLPPRPGYGCIHLAAQARVISAAQVAALR